MPTLHLGVLDVAYSTAHTGDPGKNDTTTTFEVAEKLEEKYHVMQTFFDSRKQKIADYLAESVANSINDLIRGRQIEAISSATFENKFHGIKVNYERSSLTYGADQRIETEFRRFIFANEMQKMAIGTTGAPVSMAALRGVNHRFKRPYAKRNKARPAFVDTGLYVNSFRAWTK